jgi:hypothetical protein
LSKPAHRIEAELTLRSCAQREKALVATGASTADVEALHPCAAGTAGRE